MAKNSKKLEETTAQKSNPAGPDIESSNGLGAAQSTKPARPKKASTKAAGRAKSAGKSTRKAAAPRKPRANTAAHSTAAGEATVSDEMIRIRAYFISEWRTKNGVAGDSAHDWIEARRQLKEETRKRS